MIKFLLDHFIAAAFILLLIIGSISYYFQVIRWERKQRKKQKEMQDPFFDTKKFRNQHKN